MAKLEVLDMGSSALRPLLLNYRGLQPNRQWRIYRVDRAECWTQSVSDVIHRIRLRWNWVHPHLKSVLDHCHSENLSVATVALQKASFVWNVSSYGSTKFNIWLENLNIIKIFVYFTHVIPSLPVRVSGHAILAFSSNNSKSNVYVYSVSTWELEILSYFIRRSLMTLWHNEGWNEAKITTSARRAIKRHYLLTKACI